MKWAITIEIEAPDGSVFRVTPAAQSIKVDTSPQGFGEPTYVPPFEDELIPLPDGVMPVPGDVTPFRGMAQNPGPSVCPVHRLPWRMVPAGVSKKTGQPYSAFAACPGRGCDQQPQA